MEKAFRTKRLWLVIAIIIIAVLCAVCLVACGGGDNSNDGDSDKPHTVHSYDNYVCTVCGEYAPDAPITEGLSYAEVEEYDWEKDENVVVGYAVIGIGDVTDTTIMIPQSYNDKPVTDIDWYAFSNCSSLTSITIPNSVTRIGVLAFRFCSSLTSIVIPNSVTRIEDSAFYGCSSLTSIKIQNGVTSIGRNAFDDTAYYKNAKNWEKEVLYIGKHLIVAKTTISVAYTIKQGTLNIADRAFYSCSSLTSVTIPNSVTNIGSSAFYGCVSLTSIEIPGSVSTISNYAFMGCESLTSVTISNNVTDINARAFAGCGSLTRITIPNSVTGIGPGAFEWCVSLVNINFDGTMEQWEAIGKNELWNKGIFWNQGIYFKLIETVECTDGTITLSDNSEL